MDRGDSYANGLTDEGDLGPAQRGTMERLNRAHRADAARRGRREARRGLGFMSNPFDQEENTVLHMAWLWGWRSARRGMDRALRKATPYPEADLDNRLDDIIENARQLKSALFTYNVEKMERQFRLLRFSIEQLDADYGAALAVVREWYEDV